MKIYWLVQQLDYIGGTEMVTSNIINSISDKYDINIISTAEINNNAYYFNPSVKISSLNVPIELCRIDFYFKKYLNELRFFKIIGLGFKAAYYYTIGYRKDKKRIKKLTTNEDIIISSSADSYMLSPKKRNVVYHFHFNGKYFLSLSNILLRRLIRKPDYYIYLTKTTLDKVTSKRKKLAYKDVKYIYNPVRLTPELHLTFNNNKIVFLARFLPQKDPMLAMKVAKSLKDKNFNHELHFYGEGDFLKDMESYKNKHKLSNVFFHPMTINVLEVLHSADLLLVTSNFEGLPLGVIEANSQSVPVISSNWGDATYEVIQNGINGYVIDERKPEYFADKIIEVLSDKESYKKLRKSSYESSFRFEINNIKNEWITTIEKIKEEISK